MISWHHGITTPSRPKTSSPSWVTRTLAEQRTRRDSLTKLEDLTHPRSAGGCTGLSGENADEPWFKGKITGKMTAFNQMMAMFERFSEDRWWHTTLYRWILRHSTFLDTILHPYYKVPLHHFEIFLKWAELWDRKSHLPPLNCFCGMKGTWISDATKFGQLCLCFGTCWTPFFFQAGMVFECFSVTLPPDNQPKILDMLSAETERFWCSIP